MILCIMIKDIKKFNIMLSNVKSTNHLLLNEIKKETTIIIDWNDLNEAYLKFLSIYKNIDIDYFIHQTCNKIIYKLHQEITIKKTIQLKKNKEKKILWGHIPRSGKSYIMAGTIIEDTIEKDKSNYLIITTAPNETITQYLEIYNSIEFQDFNVIYLNGETKNDIEIKNKNIIISSKQFLQNKTDEKNILSDIKKIYFDICFMDESHFGGTTEKAKNVLKCYTNNTFMIYITATYEKPEKDYDIKKENKILWDLEDVNLCKNITNEKNLQRLYYKHGNIFEECIKKYNYESIISEYSKYPSLMIMTEELSSENINDLLDKTKNNNYGYSLESIFLLKQRIQKINTEIKSKNKKRKEDNKLIVKCNETTEIVYEDSFQNEEQVLHLFYRIFGKKDEYGIPYDNYPDNSVYIKRIEKICKNTEFNSRTFTQKTKPIIIMCFLSLQNINFLSNAIIKLLTEFNVVPDYELVSINSEECGNNSKKMISETYQKAIQNKKKGVIVFSGRRYIY